MTQEVEYGGALERAAVIATLIQGEVLAVADACVVIGDAAAPLSAEVADTAEELGMTEGLVMAPHVLTTLCSSPRPATCRRRRPMSGRAR